MTTKQQIQPTRLLVILVLIVGIFVGLLSGAPHLGISPLAARAIAMVPASLVLWIFSGLPLGLTAVLILVILPLLGIQEFKTTAGTLGQPFVWLLLSTFIVGQAVHKSHLGRRVALFLLMLGRGNSGLTLLATMLSTLALSILLPTSSGRTSVLAPICDDMANIMDEARDDHAVAEHRRGNLARSMFIALAYVANVTGIAVMTGSSAATYAAGISPELFGHSWDYVGWIAVFFPSALLFILLLWAGLLLLFRPEWRVIPGGLAYVTSSLNALGSLKLLEWKTVLWLSAVVLGWLTAPMHGFSIPMVALCGAIGLCLPYIGVLDWDDALKHVSWEVILMFCAGFSLALSLQSSGAAAWIATSVANSVTHPSPFVAALALLAVVSLVRLAFTNMVAMMAMMLPIVLRMAEIWNIGPVWLSLFAIVGVTFGYMLISQTPSSGITYAYGRYSIKDFTKAGTMAMAISWVITIALAFTLWPFLGYRPGG